MRLSRCVGTRMSKALVLVRVGGRSVHERWVAGGKPAEWDLHLLPFEPIAAHDGSEAVVHDVVPGPKWSGIRTLLNEWHGWRDYDYIWLPDDDIDADAETISRMFQVAREVGLDLFAPALHESSYYAHFDTMRNPSFYGRWTGFVEIMIPGFSRTALDKLLPTLDLTETGWGWGLDSVWPKLLDYRNVGIIDGTPVVHTRPVGQMRDLELAARVHAESDSILARYDCEQMHTAFGAFGPDLARLDLNAEQLLDQLVKGLRYLIDADPRILDWVTTYQQPPFVCPDYPIEGTPEARPLSRPA